MIEGSPRSHSPEQHKFPKLDAATRALSQLIKDNQTADSRINGYIGHDALVKRSEKWIDTAREHHAYLEPALDLLDAVQHRTLMEGVASKNVTKAIESSFSQVEDQNARKLMTDILFGKVQRDALFSEQIYNASRKSLGEKATELAKAVTPRTATGSSPKPEGLKNVTLEHVVRAALTGDIKLSRTHA